MSGRRQAVANKEELWRLKRELESCKKSAEIGEQQVADLRVARMGDGAARVPTGG